MVLADQIAEIFDRFVVFGPEQRDTCVLWVLHCWTIDAHYTTPRLHVTSPEPECGKSTLLELLAELGPEPLAATSASASAIYRELEKCPPVLLDETDNTIGRKNAKESEGLALLYAVFNSGYTRGRLGRVLRSNLKKGETEKFKTFAPAAFAGISGEFDSAMRSRMITIALDKGDPAEDYEPSWEQDAAFSDLRQTCEQWASVHLEAIREACPPLEHLDGRRRQLWKPLLAVAQVLDGDWPARGERACEGLSAWVPPDGPHPAHQMLVDCQVAFGEDDRLPTRLLIERLERIEESGWETWNRGKGLHSKTLAKLLGRYKIHSETLRIDGEDVKGYRRETFEDTWARYCPRSEQVSNNVITHSPPALFVESTANGNGQRQTLKVNPSVAVDSGSFPVDVDAEPLTEAPSRRGESVSVDQPLTQSTDTHTSEPVGLPLTDPLEFMDEQQGIGRFRR